MGMRAHCRAVADSMGGFLPEQAIPGLVQAFGGGAHLEALVREEFTRPAGAAPENVEARPLENDLNELPAEVRTHCDAIARAHGGSLPAHLVTHFATVFGLDEERLRAVYGGAR